MTERALPQERVLSSIPVITMWLFNFSFLQQLLHALSRFYPFRRESLAVDPISGGFVVRGRLVLAQKRRQLAPDHSMSPGRALASVSKGCSSFQDHG